MEIPFLSRSLQDAAPLAHPHVHGLLRAGVQRCRVAGAHAGEGAAPARPPRRVRHQPLARPGRHGSRRRLPGAAPGAGATAQAPRIPALVQPGAVCLEAPATTSTSCTATAPISPTPSSGRWPALLGMKSLVKASLANDDLLDLSRRVTGKLHRLMLRRVDACVGTSRDLVDEFRAGGMAPRAHPPPAQRRRHRALPPLAGARDARCPARNAWRCRASSRSCSTWVCSTSERTSSGWPSNGWHRTRSAPARCCWRSGPQGRDDPRRRAARAAGRPGRAHPLRFALRDFQRRRRAVLPVRRSAGAAFVQGRPAQCRAGGHGQRPALRGSTRQRQPRADRRRRDRLHLRAGRRARPGRRGAALPGTRRPRRWANRPGRLARGSVTRSAPSPTTTKRSMHGCCRGQQDAALPLADDHRTVPAHQGRHGGVVRRRFPPPGRQVGAHRDGGGAGRCRVRPGPSEHRPSAQARTQPVAAAGIAGHVYRGCSCGRCGWRSANRFVAVLAGRALPEGLVAWAVGRLRGCKVLIYAHGEELTGWGRGWKFKTMCFTLRRADTSWRTATSPATR